MRGPKAQSATSPGSDPVCIPAPIDDRTACGISELEKRSPLAADGKIAVFSGAVNQYSVQLPKIFVIVGAILAFLYALVVPPFQVSDEDRHFCRAYSVSELKLVAPVETQLPATFVRLYDRFSPKFERIPEKRVVRLREIVQWLKQPLRSDSTVAGYNPNGNLYSFVPYVPVALIFRMGRLLNWPILAQMYAGRLANAAIYIWLLYLALRILPEFRLLLLAIALTPMSLYQAASLSADSITLALTALFTALAFRLAFDQTIVRVRQRDQLLTVLLLVAIALCKFNLWIGLLVLLIPAKKFGGRRKAAVFVSICTLFTCATGFGWQHLNSSAISAFHYASAAAGKATDDNLAFVFDHPFRFVGNMLLTDATSHWLWWNEFVGLFGHLTIPMHPLLIIVYTGAIIMAARSRSAEVIVRPLQKVILGSFVLLTFVSLHVLLWVFETDAQRLQQAFIAPVQIIGIQGRYFLPIALPALAVVSRRPFELRRPLVLGVLITVVVVNTMALLTIWRVYS